MKVKNRKCFQWRSVPLFLLTSTIMVGCMNAKVCTASENESKWMTEDSVVIKKVGKELSKVLFTPDSVKCYSIVYKDSIDKAKDTVVFDGYVRSGLIETLHKSQLAVLQYLLLSNEKNYCVDSIKVQAPYMPHLEFAFICNDTLRTSVVISNLDRSWQIVKDGKQKTSYNYVDSKAVERFCNYFIKKSKSDKR